MEIQPTIVHGSGTTGVYHDFGNLTRCDALEFAIANGCHRPVTNLEKDIANASGDETLGIKRNIQSVFRHNIVWLWIVGEVVSMQDREINGEPITADQKAALNHLYQDITAGTDIVPDELYQQSSGADLAILPRSYTEESILRGLARNDAYAITKAVWERYDELKQDHDPSINSFLLSQILFRVDDAITTCTYPAWSEAMGAPPSLVSLKREFFALHYSLKGRLEDVVQRYSKLNRWKELLQPEIKLQIRKQISAWIDHPEKNLQGEDAMRSQLRSLSNGPFNFIRQSIPAKGDDVSDFKMRSFIKMVDGEARTREKKYITVRSKGR